MEETSYSFLYGNKKPKDNSSSIAIKKNVLFKKKMFPDSIEKNISERLTKKVNITINNFFVADCIFSHYEIERAE